MYGELRISRRQAENKKMNILLDKRWGNLIPYWVITFFVLCLSIIHGTANVAKMYKTNGRDVAEMVG